MYTLNDTWNNINAAIKTSLVILFNLVYTMSKLLKCGQIMR